MTTATLAEPITGFRSLPLSPALIDALDRAKYYTPTPIQAALVPHALQGRDVIGQAQTGTGKTASFVIPFWNAWSEDELGAGPQGIILAPTRELVVQVAEEANKLAPHPACKALAIYGGQRIRGQLTALKAGCNLVVGSPGRVLDHLARGTLKLDRVRYVVLDEADRMLDIGFRPDIEKILRSCPRQRQTLLLSATLPAPVLRLAQRYMQEPLHINLSPATLTVENIKQSYITVEEERKFSLLVRVLKREQPRQCIIFCQRKRWADAVFKALKKYHPTAAAMHGDLQQSSREKIMADFRAGKVTILVATDVVGRGIDVTGISHIINYDLPEDIENYVHRIGRTGRMGMDGIAISFVTPEQGKLLTEIELTINKLITPDRIEGFQAFKPKTRQGQTPPAAPATPGPAGSPAAAMAAPAPVAEAPPPPASKPVFGRSTKRYSNRL